MNGFRWIAHRIDCWLLRLVNEPPHHIRQNRHGDYVCRTCKRKAYR